MKFRKCLTPLVGLAFLGTAIAIASWPEGVVDEQVLNSSSGVYVKPVFLVGGSRFVRFSGVTRPSDQARLSFVVGGRLADVYVEVGDKVAAGKVLAMLDTDEFELMERAAASAAAELEVRLAQAKRSQRRVEVLHQKQAATDEEVEQVVVATKSLDAALRSAAVKLDQARRLIRESKLVAPFEGTIIDLQLEQGEWAGAGRPVVEIVGRKDFEIEVEVPESVVSDVVEGRPVRVEFPLRKLETTGIVSSSARASAGMGRLFPVVISLQDHQDVIAGAVANVDLEIKQSEKLVIPLEAILNPGSSRPSVFRVCDRRAEQVFVSIERIDGEDVRISGGLRDGDHVVISGHTALADGDEVHISQRILAEAQRSANDGVL